jgi:hypothetical protein
MQSALRIFLAFIFSISIAAGQNPAKGVMMKMVSACDANKSGKFTLRSIERLVNGKMTESTMLVKYIAKPKKIYLYCVEPSPGTEVLFREGWLNDRLYVNPSGFPYVNLKLSPFSSLVRKDTHHTIYQIGFEYIATMIHFYSEMYGERFYRYLNIKDTVNFDNRKCIHLSFEFKEFQQVRYTVLPGETITTIADKFHLNDYSILLLNPDIPDYDNVKAGQVIRIPNFYNRRVDFYVDTFTWLPLIQEVYDDKGLFERYELKSFVNNPDFTADEFTPEFKGYSF